MSSTESSGVLTEQNGTSDGELNNTDVTEEPSGGSVYSYAPCGYCDTMCVYYAIETCFTLGIIANAIVLLRVGRDKHLRNPTFVSIAACALADMCFLMTNLSRSFEAVILTVTCNYPSTVFSVTYLILKAVAWFSANAHVALLAILRYVWLTFPIKANVYLSIRRVIVLSVFVWILGLVLMSILTILIFFTNFSGGGSKEFNLVFWTATYLMPLVTTVTLHVVKMYKVKKMTSETATERTKRLLRTMSRMVILVVFMATVLPFPYILYTCLQSFVADLHVYMSPTVSTHVYGVVNLLVLLNHSINPILYAFLSEPFRMSLKRMVGLDRNAADDNTVTGMTSLSEIQKREIILKRMDA